jgi:DNA-binding response OmpR family regulator
MATILVIEDEKDCSDMLSRVLTHEGHVVLSAANGWEGLIAVDEQPVDLIVLDLMMPGMDGYTFLQILRDDRKHTNIPVIVLTAMEHSIHDSRAQRLGVQDMFLKTQPISMLAESVHRHLPKSDPDRPSIGGGYLPEL